MNDPIPDWWSSSLYFSISSVSNLPLLCCIFCHSNCFSILGLTVFPNHSRECPDLIMITEITVLSIIICSKSLFRCILEYIITRPFFCNSFFCSSCFKYKFLSVFFTVSESIIYQYRYNLRLLSSRRIKIKMPRRRLRIFMRFYFFRTSSEPTFKCK